MANTRKYSILICDQCINLEGECCNNPYCVFCRRSMKEVGEYLNVMLIRPVVDGERFGADYAFSGVPEETCSHKGPHLSHTFGGRPAILCPGIPFTPHKPACPVMKGHHSLMCNCEDVTTADEEKKK